MYCASTAQISMPIPYSTAAQPPRPLHVRTILDNDDPAGWNAALPSDGHPPNAPVTMSTQKHICPQ